jgi:hypothetical protein
MAQSDFARAGFVVGLVGVVIAGALGIRAILQDARKIDVQAIPISQRPGAELVNINGVNTGHRAVEVIDIGFELESGDQFIPPTAGSPTNRSARLPRLLEEGQSVNVYFEASSIHRGRDKARRAFVAAASGETFFASLVPALRELHAEARRTRGQRHPKRRQG